MLSWGDCILVSVIASPLGQSNLTHRNRDYFPKARNDGLSLTYNAPTKIVHVPLFDHLCAAIIRGCLRAGNRSLFRITSARWCAPQRGDSSRLCRGGWLAPAYLPGGLWRS